MVVLECSSTYFVMHVVCFTQQFFIELASWYHHALKTVVLFKTFILSSTKHALFEGFPFFPLTLFYRVMGFCALFSEYYLGVPLYFFLIPHIQELCLTVVTNYLVFFWAGDNLYYIIHILLFFLISNYTNGYVRTCGPFPSHVHHL